MHCSEAIWQRCWASASDAKLRVGAVWGAAQVSLIVFVFGFGGFLAVWGGLWVPSGPDDPGNTILFALLNSQGQQVCGTNPKPTGPASGLALTITCVGTTCFRPLQSLQPLRCLLAHMHAWQMQSCRRRALCNMYMIHSTLLWDGSIMPINSAQGDLTSCSLRVSGMRSAHSLSDKLLCLSRAMSMHTLLWQHMHARQRQDAKPP